MKLTKMFVAVGLSALSLSAQSSGLSKFREVFEVNAGGGFTNGLYSTGKRTDTGYNFTGGLGFKTKWFGARAEYSYVNMGINPATSNSLGFPGGSIRIQSVTLNPMVELSPRGWIHPYVIGGGGWYQVQQRFNAPNTPTFQGWDPYFHLDYRSPVPSGIVPVTQVVNKGGINGGGGIKFNTWHNVKAYAEWRFHYIWTTPNATVYSPVTLGVEF